MLAAVKVKKTKLQQEAKGIWRRLHQMTRAHGTQRTQHMPPPI